MIQMLFYIRFRGQLRRTRPDLIASLEGKVAKAAQEAGGTVEMGRKVLNAAFDGGRICFWLDMVIFIEKVHKALENAAPELYGFTFILGRDIPETSIRYMCRSLSAENNKGSTGIWCSREARDALEPYMGFRTSVQMELDGGSSDYWELGEFRSFGTGRELSGRYNSGGQDSLSPEKEFPYLGKIKRTLALGADKNTIILGPEYAGAKAGIYHFCAEQLGNVPPLVVRFSADKRGLVCFADAWTDEIRSLIAGAASGEKPGAFLQSMDDLYDQLFKERLREEWSPYMLEKGRQFAGALLSAYGAAAGIRTVCGILVLENISLAGAGTAGIITEVYSSIGNPLLVLASDSTTEEPLREWSGIFSRILKLNTEDFLAPEKPDLPVDLWEAAYNIFLLQKYFPAALIPRLFEEEGLNRDMYFRALLMLEALGVLIPEDPQPRIRDFVRRAEKALGGEGTEKIRSAVRSRILDWEKSGKINPCFSLLKILSELGEKAADSLVLRSVRDDVYSGTYRGIENALAGGSFASLTGSGNAPVLEYIFKTLKSLVWGGEAEIRLVFREQVPSMTLEDGRPCYEGCRAQVQTNLASFYLGNRSIDSASEALRKALILNRDLDKAAVPAYRLFALVNLSKQRIDDALEYISFAVDQSEKTGQTGELLLDYFFASSINFLYGNLSKAERFAVKAEKTASELGQTEWEMRARFLRGRLYFEVGKYGNALEIFESLGSLVTGGSEGSAGPRKQEMICTVQAWIYRTMNFLGRPYGGGDSAAPAGPDAGIFEIESAYFTADYKRTMALADAYLSASGGERGDHFIFTEQPDWKSGFSQCEYLFRKENTQGTRLVRVYRAMAQCAMHPSLDTTMEVLGDMQRFIRDELLPDIDPNDNFFFYAWYCMLRDAESPGASRASPVDMDTVVSMAFKRLQRRAGRIDDTGMRQAFLNLSRWNSTLYLAAREFKLI